MDKLEFSKGRIKISQILSSDAYTISSSSTVSDKAKEKSVYNFTNRFSPKDCWPEVCNDSRMVFFGLSEYIRRNLATPITREDVLESAKFMSTAHSFGGPMFFDKDLWMAVVDDFGGYLPIRIDAIKEGSTFFPQEPIIQVFNTALNHGEMAAHIESVLLGMVSIMTSRATLNRHLLQWIRQWVKKYTSPDDEANVDTIAQWMIQDFGARASSCSEESELLGLSHMLSFRGTDTFSGAFLSKKLNGNPLHGNSILALSHRLVQGYENEDQCFEALHKSCQGSIGSFVADCYNFDEALKKLGQIAKNDSTTIIVVRPDSGDYVQNVVDICIHARELGLCKKGEYGDEATNLKFIQGDSINPQKMSQIFNALVFHGFNPILNGIFGIGGYLRNSCTRDSLSSAYKLSSVGTENRPVMKLSESMTKTSIPGPNKLIRGLPSTRPTVLFAHEKGCNRPNTNEGESAYQTYYDGSKPGLEKFGDACVEDFAVVQRRNIEDFDSWESIARENPELGLNEELLSEEICQIRKDFYDKYRA